MALVGGVARTQSAEWFANDAAMGSATDPLAWWRLVVVISEERGSAMEWKPEDRFRSNRGKGPLVARILGETPKCLEMELWNERHKNPIRRKFRLSARFLASPNCRWRKVRKDNLREIQRIDRKKEAEWRQAMENAG